MAEREPWSPRSDEGKKIFKDLEPIWPEFVDAYLEEALWSSLGGKDEATGRSYYIWDFAKEAVAHAVKDSNSFIRRNFQDLIETSLPWSHGHSFWLTRNRLEGGFLDRGYGAAGKRLAQAAHSYAELMAYVGDDGKIYFR